MTKAVTQLPPFHLAFPVNDIAEARQFYGSLLGCPEGRSAPDWVDFNFYGHQIVAHLAPEEAGHRATSAVDGDAVRSEEHTSELQSRQYLVCRLLLEKKKDAAMATWAESTGMATTQATSANTR